MPIGYGQEIWKSSIVSRAQTGWLVTLVGFLNPPPLQNLGGVVWQNISVISCPNRVRVSNHKRNVTEESRQSLSVFFSEGLFSIYLILLWKSMNGSIVFAFATLGDVFPEIHIHPALPHCTCINRVGPAIHPEQKIRRWTERFSSRFSVPSPFHPTSIFTAAAQSSLSLVSLSMSEYRRFFPTVLQSQSTSQCFTSIMNQVFGDIMRPREGK